MPRRVTPSGCCLGWRPPCGNPAGVPLSAHRPTADQAPADGRAGLLSGTVLVALGLGVGQVLSYGLNVIAARALPPEEFGALGALLGVVIIANTVGMALQTVAARRIALLPPGERPLAAQRVHRLTLLASVLVGAVIALTAPLLARLFELSGVVPALLVAAAMVPVTAVGGQIGIAQGGQYFARVGLLFAVVVGARSVGGVIGAVATRTLTGTLLGFLVGALVAWAAGHLVVRALLSIDAAPLPGFRRETAHVWNALLSLFVLTNLDVLLARVFLPAFESGEYAVGVLMAKIAFFLPQVFVVVAFPRMAQAKDARPVLLATAATGALGLVVTAGAAVASTLVVRVLGGASYLPLAPQLWLFAALGSVYALVQVLLFGRIAATDRRSVAAVWAAVAVLALVVTLWRHATVTEIVTTALAVAIVLTSVGLWVTVRGGRPEPAGDPAPVAG